MRTAGVTLIVIALAGLLTASLASASPATVEVRVEGKTQTLFEGPIHTEGHAIEASSDTQLRPCDGTNGGAHATAGPTPTAAAVDAMTISGQSFDGVWSAGFDDYQITRWGPDKQSTAENEFWGLLVDQTFTAKGGCQYQLVEGDQVLWVYDAFKGLPLLTLAAADDGSIPPSMTAAAKLGQPFAVKVASYTSSEGTHHDLGPKQGAEVSPVNTAANGWQSLETASPSTATTAADGIATVTFTTAGWHRLKASAAEAIRSNRLDVCVPPEGATDCGALPSDDQVRGVGPGEPPEEPPPGEPGPGPQPKSDTPLGLQGASPSTSGSTIAAGVGVLGNAQSLNSRQLRLQGLVLTPTDDRAASLTYTGRWRAIGEAGAWSRTLSLGATGAALTVHLAAGRPVLIVRHVRHMAKVTIAVGKQRQLVTIAGSQTATSRLVIGRRRARAGTVRVRVVQGTVGIDGVAVVS